jgi:hypothetical protein
MYLVSMYKKDCKWLEMPMLYIEYAPEELTGPTQPWTAMPAYNNLPAE